MSLAQVFFSEFCKISNTTFPTELFRTTASIQIQHSEAAFHHQSTNYPYIFTKQLTRKSDKQKRHKLPYPSPFEDRQSKWFRLLERYVQSFFFVHPARIVLTQKGENRRSAACPLKILIPIRNSRPEVFCKQGVFLEISQNSQENTCAIVSFLIKLQTSGLKSATSLKKRLWHRCFTVNFAKFLRTLFVTEHLRWLFLTYFIVIRVSSTSSTYPKHS